PNPDIIPIQSKSDIENLEENQLGAILTLEGCHPIGNDINKLIRLIDEGVRIVGLTWNNSNAVADSITSHNNKGVSRFGEDVIQLLNEEMIWTDVSHLSVQGFYDVIEQADHVIASHSNAAHICPHPRNLTDHQIKSIIDRDGLIGVTFVPEFTKEADIVTIPDLIRHIDYFIEMGASDQLCFGSDFDGITNTIVGLENVLGFHRIKSYLTEHYSKSIVEKMTRQNFINKFPRIK
ncbi:MAG: membrane dipeptidase, partial [Amphibacillus sp.]|nr:membrane dipeptidase [Amphibacillus sp.]